MSPFARYTIGLVLPFLAVIPTVPLLERSDIVVYGMPLALVWLFGCIPFASLCLAIVWFGHDRNQPDEQIEAHYDADAHQ